MKQLIKFTGFGGCVIAVLLSATAQEAPEDIRFDMGGDIRARYEFKDNFPDKGKATAGSAYSDYLRFRTRIWAEMEAGEHFSTRIRLGNEFRTYRKAPNNSKQKFPDELFIDNLYVQWQDDAFGLKLGRQDIKKGAGRIVSDGTPGDGSRSAFFDAAVLTLNFGEKSNVDLIGAWNHYRNELSVGHSHGNVYDMTKIKSGEPYSKMDEYGLIAYAEIREMDDLPLDLYWIWKKEESFRSKADRYPGRDFHTVGMRIVPRITDWLSAEVEAAYQFGRVDSASDFDSRNISAGMVYGGLSANGNTIDWTPSLTLAMLYFSGDRDSYYQTTDGSTDSGWNPVFNRTTWISEIASGMYDQFRWSNLMYPHVEAGVQPVKGHKVTLQMGPMYAAKKDNEATDSYRGFFAQGKYTFPLPEVAGIKFGGAVIGELLDYGDYYDAEESVATFVRFQMTAKF